MRVHACGHLVVVRYDGEFPGRLGSRAWWFSAGGLDQRFDALDDGRDIIEDMGCDVENDGEKFFFRPRVEACSVEFEEDVGRGEGDPLVPVIVFFDCCQNAAKLSSGPALRHYQDLVRIFALSGTDEMTVSMDDVEKARNDKAALAKLSARDPQVTKDLRIAWLDDDEEADVTAIRRLTQPVSLDMLAKASIGRKLLELKINPAGPQVSMQRKLRRRGCR